MAIQNDYMIFDTKKELTINEIYNCLDKIAPFNLAEDFDNVGLLLGDKNAKSRNILICLDVTDEIVDVAIKNVVHCIVCHHPIMFDKISKINDDYFDYGILAKLMINDIAVISTHTCFDLCPINNSVKSLGIIGVGEITQSKVSPYGAVITLVDKTDFETVLTAVKSKFGGESVRAYKNTANKVGKIGYFAGSLGRSSEIILQSAGEYDILISSEFKYSNLLLAEKMKINIIDIEHNHSEKVFVNSVFSYFNDSLLT